MHRAKSIYLSLLLFISFAAFSQKAEISGRVTDFETGDSLPGVNVLSGVSQGVATDENGDFKISVEPGKIRLQFRFIGYQTLIKNLDLMPGEQLSLHIKLQPETHLLNETVVSASRYEQKISDVIVSMEIINTAKIDNTHTLSIETALQQVPGVMFLDDQVSIRSGNGYSYGVGSRVLLLLDDLPMLTGSGGEAKWDFIPLENLAQVEVIKGASSALYGSSALNGVINVRTAWPEQKPQTNIMLYGGLYGQPKREEIAWWDGSPFYSGIRLSHSRMIGNFDVVAGVNVFKDEGYREGENEETARFNINTRYRSQKVKGLSGGVNMNAMRSEGGNFLLWLDGDTGVYRPSPTFDQYFRNTRFNLDPHLTYHTPNNGRHSLKGRIYQVSYDNDTIMYNHDDSYFAEYQYLKRWNNGWSLTAGASATYIYSNSNLFGNQKHDATNHSVYFQSERKFRKLSLSLGGRYEWHAINSERQKSRPLLRAGLNYQVAPYTFIRSSFGQGYRYPAIAEKYAATEAGALKVFPNEDLEPEYGWNAEIGLKQGFAFRDVQGYLDVALFWSEYQNMIEFSFGQHYPDSITNPTFNQYLQYTGLRLLTSAMHGLPASR
jgi:outer membrane cobalamin receptor